MKLSSWVTKSFIVAKIFKGDNDVLPGEVMSNRQEIVGKLTSCDAS